MIRVNSDITTERSSESDESSQDKYFDKMLRKKYELDEAGETYILQLYTQQSSAARIARGGKVKNDHHITEKIYSSLSNKEKFCVLKLCVEKHGYYSKLSDKNILSQQLTGRDSKDKESCDHSNRIVPATDERNSVSITKLSRQVAGLAENEEFSLPENHILVPTAQGDPASIGEDNTSRGENMRRSRIQQPMLRAKNAGSMSETRADKRDVDLVYQFQRWTGDHTVKVLIPADLSRDGKITLLPSDTRVADALSRNMDRSMHRMSDLLLQQQDKDERQHHQDEEEKE
ncbi:hypothetical protein BN439_1968 [Erwinia amylovora Ea644]|nr:hypothetical protein BN439_1968 [Erwinia amylovora Ea644]